MLLTAKWLQKYLPDLDLSSVADLQHTLDTRLTEIESLTIKGENLSGLKVVDVVKCVEHPSNKKLHVCTVKYLGQEFEVVCGAPNVREGLKAVWCSPGGSVIDSKTGEKITISNKEVAGVTSAGMLCSAKEIGLGDDHSGIMELDESTPNGLDITNLLQDIVLEIQNKAIPHRPDCFNHLGIAREIGIIYKLKLNNDLTTIDTSDFKVEAESVKPLEVKTEDKNSCKEFTAIVMDNVQIKNSPLWLQIQLIYCGIRPVNNIVDITNYIMLDIGQPLHAFDYDKINGNKLIVRKAKKGEKIKTLDGKDRELDDQMTVIADNTQLESIAGVMGGAHSEITAATKTIIVEAANWEMFNIRQTSRKLGLRSEASARYEKGISQSLLLPAVYKAVQMIKDLSGAEIASELIHIKNQSEEQTTIQFHPDLVKQRIGIEIEKEWLLNLFDSIGIQITNKHQIPFEANTSSAIDIILELQIPLLRKDLKAEEDIIEEIARHYGYNNLPKTLPNRTISPTQINKPLHVISQLKLALSGSYFNEIFTYAMIGDELAQKAQIKTADMLKVVNPISPELSYVRNTIVPSLIEKVRTNLDHGYEQFGLFEIDKVALKGKKNATEPNLPDQPHKLAIVVVSDSLQSTLNKLYLGLEKISEVLNVKLEVSQDESASKHLGYLHPSQSGWVVANSKSQVGHLGILHEQINKEFDIPAKIVGVIELSEFEELIVKEAQNNRVTAYTPVSNTPTVKRDLSFWLPEEKQPAATDLVKAVYELKNPLVTKVLLLDYFNDATKKTTSLTLRVFLQDADRTLHTEEINQTIATITDKLVSKYKLTIR